MVCVRGIVALSPRVLLVLLTCLPVCRGARWAKRDSYSAYYDADGDVQNSDIYDRYNNEILYGQTMTTCPAVTQLNKRNLDRTTLKPDEIDVKEILNNILQGKKPGYVRQRRIATDQPEYPNDRLKNWQPGVELQKWSPNVYEQEYLNELSTKDTHQQWSLINQAETSTYDKNDIIAEVKKLIGVRDEEVPWRSSIESWRRTQEVQTWRTTETTEETEDTLMYPLESTTYSNSEMQAQVIKLVQHWNSSSSVNMQESTTAKSNSDMQAEVRKLVQHWNPRISVNPPESSTARNVTAVKDRGVPRRSSIVSSSTTQEVQTWSTTETTEDTADTLEDLGDDDDDSRGFGRAGDNTTETGGGGDDTTGTGGGGGDTTGTGGGGGGDTSGTGSDGTTETGGGGTVSTTETGGGGTVTTTECAARGETVPRLDIKAILAIISNLTYDYEWNLSEQFNKTILDYGVPTCGPLGSWTTTLSPGASTLYPWDFENSSVVSKCFVCGLRTPEIPRNAHCADAFAGDFLPLMPVDAKARGKIAGFRKYCRYIDSQNYIENPDDPRAIYGRFTGGCAVRWTDLTGVFTQRTCRSKFRPLMGKHLASKRMAKLELALVNVENGCIISPMATLLPVSRGISLYARFHACVCSSNWCNRATLEKFSFNTLATIMLAYWLVHYP